MKELLIESMTKVIYGPYAIRVWRQEDSANIEFSQQEVRTIVLNYLGNNHPVFSLYSLAHIFIDLIDRLNAIEILNKNGDGIVVYNGWP